MATDLHIFTKRLNEELLPTFCNDPRRNFALSGFKEHSIKVSDFDARNFLRAIDSGVVQDSGGGRYRCPRSSAFEQLFWEGGKSTEPRPITLWIEPVITIATMARLGLDFRWPANSLGMQSKDGAFDFTVFNLDASVRIAGEVKKTRLELDEMVSHVLEYGGTGATTPSSQHPKCINSFRKWTALQRCRAPIFWAVGPDDYTRLFHVRYGRERDATFMESELDLHSAERT